MLPVVLETDVCEFRGAVGGDATRVSGGDYDSHSTGIHAAGAEVAEEE